MRASEACIFFNITVICFGHHALRCRNLRNQQNGRAKLRMQIIKAPYELRDIYGVEYKAEFILEVYQTEPVALFYERIHS